MIVIMNLLIGTVSTP